MIAEGNRVAAQTIGRGTLLNGNPYENHYVFIMEVDGDKVRYMCEYMDSVSRPVELGRGPRGRRRRRARGGHAAEPRARLTASAGRRRVTREGRGRPGGGGHGPSAVRRQAGRTGHRG